MSDPTRPLTDEERTLLRWMLENGGDEARAFLPQLDRAEATTWKCPCGCVSFNLAIHGHTEPQPGWGGVADFVFGNDANCFGICVLEKAGVLQGVEVYGFGVDAPRLLPKTDELRPFGNQ